MSDMTEKPILFSGHLPRKVENGEKDVTRRLPGLHPINAAPDDWDAVGVTDGGRYEFRHQRTGETVECLCPYAVDRLWVRQTWMVVGYDKIPPRDVPSFATVYYWANDELRTDGHGTWYVAMDVHGTGGLGEPGPTGTGKPPKWRPSIHMPRKFAKTVVDVVEWRPERLQDITPEEVLREGVGIPALADELLIEAWVDLWDSINPAHPWASNPWVWRVEFTRAER